MYTHYTRVGLPLHTKHIQLSAKVQQKYDHFHFCDWANLRLPLCFSMASSRVSANRTLTIVPLGIWANSLPSHDQDFVTVGSAFSLLNVWTMSRKRSSAITMPLPFSVRRRLIVSSLSSLDENRTMIGGGIVFPGILWAHTMSPVWTFWLSLFCNIWVMIVLQSSPRTCFIPKTLMFDFLLYCSFSTLRRFTRSSLTLSSFTLFAFSSATCFISTSSLRSCMLSEFNLMFFSISWTALLSSLLQIPVISSIFCINVVCMSSMRLWMSAESFGHVAGVSAFEPRRPAMLDSVSTVKW